MQPSSTFCRRQEAHQRALAAGTALVNVQGIATLAAAAWAKEARTAEKREERLARRKLDAETGAALHLELPPPDDRSFSENPDRGLVNTGMIRK
ncbi:hypothetical protein [Sphingomonas sp. LaA6.9]|uniref:hypothetical protein n=1 Tax=Sphingomonas sp. LaA6.9 TaxID=2919914 RepID=UPI001F4FE960|nr:hypothetical protein [Sphingomonas sp. LaA6.9]MCJ8158464.1 hypothetical protein [Sphingomonas sp. LaA6.9]